MGKMGKQAGRNANNVGKDTRAKKEAPGKKNYRKLLAVAATPAIIASAFAPIAPISASADDVTSGTYTGEGYTAKWESVDGGVRLYDFFVYTTTGTSTITIPSEINGQRVVSFDNKSLDKASLTGISLSTGVHNPKSYLEFVNVPSLDIKMEFEGNPFTGLVGYGVGAVFRYTDEQGIVWTRQFEGSGSGPADYLVGSDNRGNRLAIETFTVPDNVFGPVTKIGSFKGVDIGVATLPDSVEYMRSAIPFGRDTTVRELDISNLKNLKAAVTTLATMKGENSKLVLGQSYLTARTTLNGSMNNDVPTLLITEESDVLGTLAFSEDVTTINTPLFKGSNMGKGHVVSEVILHEGITTIGSNAFRNLKVENPITLPSTLKVISDRAFEFSRGAIPKDFVIPDGVTSIGSTAFKNSAWADGYNSLVIPESVMSVGTDAFGMAWYNKVVVYSKYLKYPVNNRSFGLAPTGVIYGYLGSTTETVYNATGFRPIDGLEPIISTNLVNGTTYDGSVTPTFTIENADNVTYTLNGQPYDGKSPITTGGVNTLKVVAENAHLSTTKTYSFSVTANEAPTIVGSIDNQTVAKDDILTLDLKGLFNDPEGAALTYNVTTSDTRGSEVWTNARGELKFKATIKDTYDVTVTATDGKNTSEAITFSVTVGDAVVAPVDPPVVEPVDPPVTEPTEPAQPTPPVIEDKGQVTVAELERSFSEVIDVSMVGLNTEKVIQLGGLLDILNLENPKITLSSTNDDVVSYDFNTDDQTIKLTNLQEGFSNIQVVAESGGSKVVVLLMVDSYGTANFGVNYIGDGQIYAGLEAYVVPVAEVFENVDLQNGDRFAVSVKKIEPNGNVTPVKDESTTTPDTAPVAMTRAAFASTSFDFLSPSTFRMAATTPVLPASHLDVPQGVQVHDLYNADGLVVKLVNGRLVVEGSEKSAYDIVVTHEKADGSAPVEVAFKLDVLTKDAAGGGNGNPPIDGTSPDGNGGTGNPPIDGTSPDGNGGTGNPPIDGTSPDGNGGTGNPPIDGTSPDGNGGTGNPPIDGTTPDGNGGNGDKPTDGTTPDGNGGTGNPPIDGTTPDGNGGNGDKPTDGTTPDGNGGNGDKPTDGTSPDGNGGNGDKPTDGTSPDGNGGNGDKPTDGEKPTPDKPITGGGSGSVPPIDGSPIIEKPIIVDTGGGGGYTPPITGITPTNPTPSPTPDKPAVESILDDVNVEIEENEKGELIIKVDDEDDVIADNEGTITISNDGAHIVVDGVEKKIAIDLGDYVFDGKRAIHLEDGHASTAMHYLKEDSLVVTTRHLDHVVITSRVSHPFEDLNPKWNNIGDIEDLYNYLVTTGTTATTYDPTSNITRAQFAVMVARALELTVGDDPTSQTLSDVDGKWYAQEVQALVDTGIITGFTDGTFGGEKHLTRQQAAAIMTRMLTHLDVNVEPTKEMTFADEVQISGYAKDSVQYLAEQGILVNGKGVKFNPHADLTRDQMAKILVRALQLSDFY